MHNEKRISSQEHPLIKHLLKLRTDSTYRHSMGRVLLVGRILLEETRKKLERISLIVQEGRSFLPTSGREQLLTISAPLMRKITGLEEPDGYAAEVLFPTHAFPTPSPHLLVLDGVSDPGNLGTLLRTAWALGWSAAVLLPGCCDPYNDKALRSSRGASLLFPWKQGSWEEVLRLAKEEGLTLLAADGAGTPLLRFERPRRIALVLGNEGKGISELTRLSCHHIAIPIRPEVESLNVAIAGAILMHWFNATFPIE